MIRCGDSVNVIVAGRVETWLVAYADYDRGHLAWFGWPNGEIKLSECTLVKSCSDEEHAKAVAEWLDKAHARDDYGCEDRRVHHVRRLYRPEEHARLERQRCEARIAEIEREAAFLRRELIALARAEPSRPEASPDPVALSLELPAESR